jgi:uncharacterized protein YodC (DUF2158 family)
MANEFKPGDVVRLISGGPLMTVDEVAEDNGKPMVYCIWVIGDKKMTDNFPPHTLKHM